MNLSKAKKLIRLGELESFFQSCEQFTIEEQSELLKLALTYQEAWLVLKLLNLSQLYPDDLEEKDFSLYLQLIELAGIQGDYALYQKLNKALKHPTNHPVVFYPQTIQENYTQPRLSDWCAVKHIPYMNLHQTYVGKFFVLLKNVPFVSSIHIKQLGDARAGIDTRCYGEDFLKFGVLRELGDNYVTPKKSYIKYFERLKDKKNIYPIIGNINGKLVTLTGWCRWRDCWDKQTEGWYHTNPKEFELIFPYIDEKINAFQNKYRFDDSALHTTDTIAAIREIAQIHWWFAHAMFFHRGSAAATKILIEALFRLVDIEVTAWNTEPDCEALIEPSIRDYQNHYQQFVCLSPMKQGLTLHFDPKVIEIPETFMPQILRNLLKSKQCEPMLAQSIMRKLQLSPQERQVEYQQHNLFLTDADLIALETKSLTMNEIVDTKNYSVLCSNAGINFLLKKHLNVLESRVLARYGSLHLFFSSNGAMILDNKLMTFEEINKISSDHYHSGGFPFPKHSIDFIVSAECVELMNNQLLTGKFISDNIALLTTLVLNNTFHPIYYAFESKIIDMSLLKQYESFFEKQNLSSVFFSKACQTAIQAGYLDTNHAINLIHSNQSFDFTPLTTYANLAHQINEMISLTDLKQHHEDLKALSKRLEQLYKLYFHSTDIDFFNHFYTQSKIAIETAEKKFEQEDMLWNALKPILNGLIHALNAIKSLLFNHSNKIRFFKSNTSTQWESAGCVQNFKNELEILHKTKLQTGMKNTSFQ